MLKDSITLLRNYFKDSGVQIFADNALLYDSNLDFTTLVWDDTNSLLYAFRPNNSHYDQDKKKIVIDVTEYNNIQYISSRVNRTQLLDILNGLKSSSTIDDSVMNDILSSYDKLCNKLL